MTHSNLHGIIDQLTQQGVRVTEKRKEVLAFLCKQEKPVSIKKLELALPKFNIVTLYRIVDFFVAQGVVNELTHDAKEKYFEMADPYHEHHHHMICRECGKVRDLDCKLTVPKIQNFVPDMHVVTVYGHCKKC